MLTFQYKFLYKSKIDTNLSFDREFNFDYKDIKYLKKLKKNQENYIRLHSLFLHIIINHKIY